MHKDTQTHTHRQTERENKIDSIQIHHKIRINQTKETTELVRSLTQFRTVSTLNIKRKFAIIRSSFFLRQKREKRAKLSKKESKVKRRKERMGKNQNKMKTAVSREKM